MRREIFERCLRQKWSREAYSGIVDEHVEVEPGIGQSGRDDVGGVGFGDVAENGYGFASRCDLEFRDGFGKPWGVAPNNDGLMPVSIKRFARAKPMPLDPPVTTTAGFK